jgi:hypothetical protein
MDRTPPPVSLAAALALPRTPGRSSEVFVDGDLEVRFAARPTNGRRSRINAMNSISSPPEAAIIESRKR